MNTLPLVHPVGAPPTTAPKDLVDILLPPSPHLGQQLEQVLTQHSDLSLLGWLVGLVALGGVGWLIIKLWRDRHGILLRWQLDRLSRLITRPSPVSPALDRVIPALMWALARYFSMAPAVQRTQLPPPWRPLIRELDALRFAPTPLDPDALLALMNTMRTQTRIPPERAPSC